MCTRPTPSCQSVPASAHALGTAVLAALRSLLFLLAALASAPLRQLWHPNRPRRSEALAHIDVQVHLGDAACIAELESIVWKTLARTERTWAPLRLPVDRVVVGAGFPALGRADIYDDFLSMAGETPINTTSTQSQRRVVISLGVRDGARDLDGWEIAGALSAQIQALVDERCSQHKSIAAGSTEQQTVAPTTTRLTRASITTERRPVIAAPPVAEEAHDASAPVSVPADPPPGRDVPSLADLLATVQQGQPLVAAGPSSSNGTHP